MYVSNGYPRWAASAVWYQIFPERFCRANAENPINASDIEGTTPFSLNHRNAWGIHDWTSEWYALDANEKKNDANLKTNLLRRRYCGDIKGIISKLDYLKQLGVNALYFTPLQYSPSLHKYDGTNFLHTDPFFGSNPRADIQTIAHEDFNDFDNAAWTIADRETLQLIREAHLRGMRIIFDGVFNHIGYNSRPFQDVLKHRQKSKYASWFHIDFEKSTSKSLNYQKFWGCVKEMPKLNYSSDEVRRYVFATLKRWLRPVVDGKEVDGIDGWRIDHAIGVPSTFWAQAHKFVKSLKPDSLFIGELIEDEDIIKPYLNDHIFDSVMNYGLLTEMCRFFAAEKNCITGNEFDKNLNHLLNLYPTDSNYLMQNMLGTHDTERIASYIVNRRLKKFGNIGMFFANSHAEDPHYNTRKPFKRERQIQKMMAVFQFGFIGAPMIYYGDEAGMWGANDPDCRKPMMWKELKFSGEHPVINGIQSHKTDRVKFDDGLFSFYQKLTALRREHKSLTTGTFHTLAAPDGLRLYSFARRCQGDEVIFVFNREKQSCRIDIKSKAKMLTDYFSGQEYIKKSTGLYQLEIEPNSMLVLL